MWTVTVDRSVDFPVIVQTHRRGLQTDGDENNTLHTGAQVNERIIADRSSCAF